MLADQSGKGILISTISFHFCNFSEIPHLFETGVFVVQNFSTFDDNKVVYSNEFSDCMGRTWRIMAWCVISEDHFGIYLELVHGRPCW